jgi:hypothetical protein
MLYAVTYGNSTFVATGDRAAIITSSDGISWDNRTSGISSGGLWGISYGNSTYVTVGDGGTILTSSDGISWTSRTSNATIQLFGITFP